MLDTILFNYSKDKLIFTKTSYKLKESVTTFLQFVNLLIYKKKVS